MIETEIKLRVVDLAATTAALARRGAKLQHPRGLEDNLLLDDAEGRLRGRGCLLRLRSTPAGARLTFKGPRHDRAGMKSREEFECAVGSHEVMLTILQRAGFDPVFRYQKYRTTYAWQGLEVVLDETPIGAFLEIEGSPEAIEGAAAELGYGRADYIAESYAALFLASGGTGDMVFR